MTTRAPTASASPTTESTSALVVAGTLAPVAEPAASASSTTESTSAPVFAGTPAPVAEPAASASSTGTHESALASSAVKPLLSAPKLIYHHMPESAKLVVRSYCHIWDTKGKHIRFREFSVVFNAMKDMGILQSERNMRRIYNNEKEGYMLSKSADWGYTTRPDLTQEMFELDQDLISRSKPREHQLTELEEPVIQAATDGHQNVTLPRKYYEEMKSALRSLKGTPGFGIRTVRVAAMRVWKKNFATILPGCLTPFEWVPADSWCPQISQRRDGIFVAPCHRKKGNFYWI